MLRPALEDVSLRGVAAAHGTTSAATDREIIASTSSSAMRMLTSNAPHAHTGIKYFKSADDADTHDVFARSDIGQASADRKVLHAATYDVQMSVTPGRDDTSAAGIVGPTMPSHTSSVSLELADRPPHVQVPENVVRLPGSEQEETVTSGHASWLTRLWHTDVYAVHAATGRGATMPGTLTDTSLSMMISCTRKVASKLPQLQVGPKLAISTPPRQLTDTISEEEH